MMHLDYVHAEDREIARAQRNLSGASIALNKVIAQLDRLHVELPVPQEYGDDADQAHMALYDISDSLASLYDTIRRASRRLS